MFAQNLLDIIVIQSCLDSNKNIQNFPKHQQMDKPILGVMMVLSPTKERGRNCER